MDTISRSTQLDYAVPASKIASLSSGESVGIVADDPDNKIDLKMFHSEIQNDHEALKLEASNYLLIPDVRSVDQHMRLYFGTACKKFLST